VVARSANFALPASRTTAEIFDELRAVLGDIIGMTATATYVRRACRRAAMYSPELGELAIVRKRFDFDYTIPAQWSRGLHGVAALRELARALADILNDFVGPLLVRRLHAIPGLFADC
jgi:hypothetical protein